MVSYKEIESILQTYSLPEILEYNSLSEEDVLEFLVKEDFLELPNVKPLEFEDD